MLKKGEGLSAWRSVTGVEGVAIVTGITGMAAVAVVTCIAQVAVITGGEVTSPPSATNFAVDLVVTAAAVVDIYMIMVRKDFSFQVEKLLCYTLQYHNIR